MYSIFWWYYTLASLVYFFFDYCGKIGKRTYTRSNNNIQSWRPATSFMSDVNHFKSARS